MSFDSRGQCCDTNTPAVILRILGTVFSVPNRHICPQITLKMAIFINPGVLMWPSPQIKPSGFLYEGQKSALSSFFVTNLQFTHSVWLFLVTKSVIFRRYSSGAKGDKSSEETKSFYKSLLVLLWLTSL